MDLAGLLRTIRWVLIVVLVGIALVFLIRGLRQVALDGLPASNSQWLSWRSLFELGASSASLSAAAASFLLLRSPLHRRRAVLGAICLLLAPYIYYLPQVGHFTQVDPCLNLGKAAPGELDSCSR
jgi:hypothetical protein